MLRTDLAVFTSLWMFVTPVVFPLPTTGVFATVVRANPVTPLLMTTRELATSGVISDPDRFFFGQRDCCRRAIPYLDRISTGDAFCY